MKWSLGQLLLILKPCTPKGWRNIKMLLTFPRIVTVTVWPRKKRKESTVKSLAAILLLSLKVEANVEETDGSKRLTKEWPLFQAWRSAPLPARETDPGIHAPSPKPWSSTTPSTLIIVSVAVIAFPKGDPVFIFAQMFAERQSGGGEKNNHVSVEREKVFLQGGISS